MPLSMRNFHNGSVQPLSENNPRDGKRTRRRRLWTTPSCQTQCRCRVESTCALATPVPTDNGDVGFLYLHCRWDLSASQPGHLLPREERALVLVSIPPLCLPKGFLVLIPCDFCFKKPTSGFPGGSVIKNPTANAGHTGSIPGPGRSHMLQDNEARATTPEPVL